MKGTDGTSRDAFSKAADLQARQRALLDERQRREYEAMQQEQRRQRQAKEEQIATMRERLQDMERRQRLTPSLDLKMPGAAQRARSELVREIVAEENALTRMAADHQKQNADFLQRTEGLQTRTADATSAPESWKERSARISAERRTDRGRGHGFED